MRWGRSGRNRLRLPVLGLVGVSLWATFRPQPFDPLSWDVQRVVVLRPDGVEEVPLVDGFDGVPAVRVGDGVPVSANFNVDADADVPIVGTIVWVSVDPAGVRCGDPDFVRIPNSLTPGTHTVRFENQMFQCVIDHVNETGVAQLWQIRGDVEVLAAHGVDSAWKTEEFWIVP